MKSWLVILICCFSFVAFCQNEGTANVEFHSDDSSDTLKPHSVKKAVIFSAVLPGAGQVYNHIAMPKGKKKAYWKVPLIYAGLGATGYFAIQNHIEQRNLKTEYTNRVEQNIIGDKYALYDDQAVLQLYQQTVSRRDLLFFGMGLVYLIQIADAAVEAHFVRFDVSDNLSMQVRPSFGNTQLSPTVGIGLHLNFK